MPKSKSLPQHATVVGTYAELQKYAQAFAAGYLNLLLVLGAPGLGKSRVIRQALGAEICWIDGNASPFGIYLAAYEHRGQPIVLDDVDGLHREKQGVRLLKSLCQTDKIKTLSWETNAPALEARDVPRQYTTTSRLALIANRWHSANEDVAALEDRGHILYFDPPPLEVHRNAAQWFWDQEIFDFVASHLGLIKRHSLRVYYLAYEQKLAGLDWRREVLSRCLTGAALEVARLKADAGFGTEEERAAAFVAAGHGCRATFFNHAKKLRTSAAVPVVQLVTTAPPTEPISPVDILDILRRRHGPLGNG
ncbi:MAG TPA: hypothetical protein VG125_24275 [Pirellulales bacterium]|nr:hypothetical protein [Pirellulales bacterium]